MNQRWIPSGGAWALLALWILTSQSGCVVKQDISMTTGWEDEARTAQSMPLGGEDLDQMRREMQRALRDMVHFHTTLETMQQRRDRNGVVLFSNFVSAYMGLHLDPMLQSEWQSRHPELMALDANLRLAQAEILIQMRDPRRVQAVLDEIKSRFEGRDGMLVESPSGGQGTLRDAVKRLAKGKWKG